MKVDDFIRYIRKNPVAKFKFVGCELTDYYDTDAGHFRQHLRNLNKIIILKISNNKEYDGAPGTAQDIMKKEGFLSGWYRACLNREEIYYSGYVLMIDGLEPSEKEVIYKGEKYV